MLEIIVSTLVAVIPIVVGYFGKKLTDRTRSDIISYASELAWKAVEAYKRDHKITPAAALSMFLELVRKYALEHGVKMSDRDVTVAKSKAELLSKAGKLATIDARPGSGLAHPNTTSIPVGPVGAVAKVK